MGYIVPFEGATHLHYDAHKIANSKIFKKIINYLYSQENKLTKHVQTNVNCRKLGSWDESLIELVNKPFFSNLSWKDACNEILKCKITKYCNFNILNFISNNPQKYTFEVRIFPGSICSYRIQQWSFLFAEILNFCCEHENTSTNLFTSMISEHCNNLLYEN